MASICQICLFLTNNIPAPVVYQHIFVSQVICYFIASVFLAILKRVILPEKLIKQSQEKSNGSQQQHIENLKIEQHRTLAKHGLNPLI